MHIQETYDPVRMTASGQISANAMTLGGFLASTAGSLQLRRADGAGGATGVIVVATFPVVAGGYYPIPFSFGAGCYAELTGGATGTFGVS